MSPPAALDPVSSASLRLGQVPSLQLNGQGSDASGGAMGGIMDKDALAKAEIRRARRCVKFARCTFKIVLSCGEITLFGSFKLADKL